MHRPLATPLSHSLAPMAQREGGRALTPYTRTHLARHPWRYRALARADASLAASLCRAAAEVLSQGARQVVSVVISHGVSCSLNVWIVQMTGRDDCNPILENVIA